MANLKKSFFKKFFYGFSEITTIYPKGTHGGVYSFSFFKFSKIAVNYIPLSETLSIKEISVPKWGRCLIEFFHESPMLLPLAEGTKVPSVFMRINSFLRIN